MPLLADMTVAARVSRVLEVTELKMAASANFSLASFSASFPRATPASGELHSPRLHASCNRTWAAESSTSCATADATSDDLLICHSLLLIACRQTRGRGSLSTAR